METNTAPTAAINVDLRNEYDLTGKFEPDTKICIMHHDSYMFLINMLTPEQHANVLAHAAAGDYVAVGGYVDTKR